MAVGLGEAVLAPRFSRVLCVLVVAACAAVVVSLVGWGRIEPLLRYSPAAALVAVLSVVVFWSPRIRVGPASIEVVNPFRTFAVTWPAVVDVETKWTLTIVTARRRIPVWAAPAPGPFGNLSTMRRDHRGGLLSDGAARRAPRDRTTPTAVGDVAGILVLRQWQDYRDRGLLGAPEGDGESVRLHTTALILLAALVALTAVGILWP